MGALETMGNLMKEYKTETPGFYSSEAQAKLFTKCLETAKPEIMKCIDADAFTRECVHEEMGIQKLDEVYHIEFLTKFGFNEVFDWHDHCQTTDDIIVTVNLHQDGRFATHREAETVYHEGGAGRIVVFSKLTAHKVKVMADARATMIIIMPPKKAPRQVPLWCKEKAEHRMKLLQAKLESDFFIQAHEDLKKQLKGRILSLERQLTEVPQ